MPRSSLVALGIAGVLAMAILPFAGRSQPAAPAIRVEKGIVFGKGGDTELKLDLAMPKDGDGPLPAIVCIHGGGWSRGERGQMLGTIEALARRGYVAVSPDYRLAPQHRFPAALEDCKAAVRWLRANADSYRIRSSRIGVFGYSAGAHLACLLGVTGKDDGLEGEGGNAEQSSAVQAVISFFGPTDLTQPVWNNELREQQLEPFLGGSAAEKPEAYRRASPMTYAGKNAPPFLFVHGTEDKIVPFEQSGQMVDKLRQAGVSARLVPIEGEGHGHTWPADKRALSIAHLMAFFDETLKP
jgi:acetyl esterase/lipase